MLELLLLLGSWAGVSGWSIMDSGWISVSRSPYGKQRFVLTDEHGREMLFRGVNVALMSYLEDSNAPIDPEDYQGRCPEYNNKIGRAHEI